MMRKVALAKKEARSYQHAQLLIAALRRTGQMSAARLMAGMTAGDVKHVIAEFPDIAAQVNDAIRQGSDKRIDKAIELLEKASEVALVCGDKPMEMLELAKVLAPEIAVYPLESERAKARNEQGPSAQVQVNIALGNLAERLQHALSDAPAIEAENIEAV